MRRKCNVCRGGALKGASLVRHAGATRLIWAFDCNVCKSREWRQRVYLENVPKNDARIDFKHVCSDCGVRANLALSISPEGKRTQITVTRTCAVCGLIEAERVTLDAVTG